VINFRKRRNDFVAVDKGINMLRMNGFTVPGRDIERETIRLMGQPDKKGHK